MTESVSKIIMLCFTLTFLAAVVGILASGAVSAKDIAEIGTSYFDRGTRSEPINTDKLSDSSKPVAAIAAVLRRDRESFNSFRCNICGETSVGDEIGACLKNHLSGRGILTFTQSVDGGYDVALSEG